MDTSTPTDPANTANEHFIRACNDGDLDQVRYWLTSPDLSIQADIHSGSDLGFKIACKHGHISVVQYLLTSPELTEHVDIHTEQDYGFRWACIQGHLDIVRYFLTSTELTDYADIHVEVDDGFVAACINGHLPLVQFLLSAPELAEHADIHVDNDDGFRWAGAERHIDIMAYLLTRTGDQYIDFQHTEYNLEWAISGEYTILVQKMSLSLLAHDYMQYLEWLPAIEGYCIAQGQELFYRDLCAQERAYSPTIIEESAVHLNY